MLDQRRRRWSDVVQMLCKCVVFAGIEYRAIQPASEEASSTQIHSAIILYGYFTWSDLFQYEQFTLTLSFLWETN